MKIMKSLFCVIAGAFVLGTPLLADAQESEIEKAVAADKHLLAYLEVNEAPTFESVNTYAADINGDGVRDDVFVAYRVGHSFVALGLRDAEGGFTYAGFSPIDSSCIPTVAVKDYTGNGSAEVHVLSNRGEFQRVITLVACVDGKAKRIFREILSTKSVAALSHNKVTKFINFVDTDKDGIREITVSARQTELVGTGEKEREIAGSSVTSSTVYVMKGGEYGVASHEAGVLSNDAKLSIATVLAAEGESLRARAILSNLLKNSGLDDQIAVAGTALLSTLDESFGNNAEVVTRNKPVKS